jgi:hypothetical protein
MATTRDIVRVMSGEYPEKEKREREIARLTSYYHYGLTNL